MYYNEAQRTSTNCNEVQLKLVGGQRHRRKRKDERSKSSNRNGKTRATAVRIAAADTGAARARGKCGRMVYESGNQQGHVLPSPEKGLGIYVPADGSHGR